MDDKTREKNVLKNRKARQKKKQEELLIKWDIGALETELLVNKVTNIKNYFNIFLPTQPEISFQLTFAMSILFSHFDKEDTRWINMAPAHNIDAHCMVLPATARTSRPKNTVARTNCIRVCYSYKEIEEIEKILEILLKSRQIREAKKIFLDGEVIEQNSEKFHREKCLLKSKFFNNDNTKDRESCLFISSCTQEGNYYNFAMKSFLIRPCVDPVFGLPAHQIFCISTYNKDVNILNDDFKTFKATFLRELKVDECYMHIPS
jgi:hypothetical protein